MYQLSVVNLSVCQQDNLFSINMLATMKRPSGTDSNHSFGDWEELHTKMMKLSAKSDQNDTQQQQPSSESSSAQSPTCALSSQVQNTRTTHAVNTTKLTSSSRIDSMLSVRAQASPCKATERQAGNDDVPKSPKARAHGVHETRPDTIDPDSSSVAGSLAKELENLIDEMTDDEQINSHQADHEAKSANTATATAAPTAEAEPTIIDQTQTLSGDGGDAVPESISEKSLPHPHEAEPQQKSSDPTDSADLHAASSSESSNIGGDAVPESISEKSLPHPHEAEPQQKSSDPTDSADLRAASSSESSNIETSFKWSKLTANRTTSNLLEGLNYIQDFLLLAGLSASGNDSDSVEDSADDELRVESLEQLAKKLSSLTTSIAFAGVAAHDVVDRMLADFLSMTLGKQVRPPKSLWHIDWNTSCQQELLLLHDSSLNPAIYSGLEDEPCLFKDIDSFWRPEVLPIVNELKKKPFMALEVMAELLIERRAVRQSGFCVRHNRYCRLKHSARHSAGSVCTPYSKQGLQLGLADPCVLSLLAWSLCLYIHCQCVCLCFVFPMFSL